MTEPTRAQFERSAQLSARADDPTLDERERTYARRWASIHERMAEAATEAGR